MAAVAVPPAPPSVEVTLPVTLVNVAAAALVTLTLKLQEAPAVKVAPDRLTDPDPAAAVMVPPPQVPVSPFGLATTRFAGRVSTNPRAVKLRSRSVAQADGTITPGSPPE
jgi:hypothetical protein